MLALIGSILLWAFLVVLLLALVAAGVCNFVLPSVVLRASCSVADVKEPPYLLSFPLGYAAVVVYVLLGMAFILFLGKLDAEPDGLFGSMHLLGYALGLALGWVVASLAYRLILAPTFLQGFRVAGLQLLLYALIAGLELGIGLTAFSVGQMLGVGPPGWGAPPKTAAAQVVPAPVPRS